MAASPKLGDDGVVSEAHPLPENLLPREVGLRKQSVVYSCLDASRYYLVVGSMQGYVWVVDLKSTSILREFNEFKGSSVTVVKLNPLKDCVAYATDGGVVRVERVTRSVSTKWRAQEKDGTPVSSLEWSPAGDNLYVGFTNGRVIQFHLQYPDGAFTPGPDDFPQYYGSHVTQLSASVQALLVSTEERALMVDVKTHKLAQVGRKDRKIGPFGGFFVQDGSIAYVARPGLRLWVADNAGKVSHTIAFKEALSTKHLPTISLKSTTSLQPSFTKSWQFTSLHPWISDRFILSLHGNTLFVLDPEEGNIVGVLTLEHSISALATSRGNLFVLCRGGSTLGTILRLSIHPSFVKIKPSPLLNVRRFVGNLSAASSRASSREVLDQLQTERNEGRVSPLPDHLREKDETPSVVGEREVSARDGSKLKLAGNHEVTKREASERTVSEVSAETTTPRGPLPEVVEREGEEVEKDGVERRDVREEEGKTVVAGEKFDTASEKVKESENSMENVGHGLHKEIVEIKIEDTCQGGNDLAPKTDAQQTDLHVEDQSMKSDQTTMQQDSSQQDDKLESVSSQSTNDTSSTHQHESESSTSKELEPEQEPSPIPEPTKVKSLLPTSALVQGISHVKADLKEITGVLKLGKLTEFISQATSSSPTLQRKSEQQASSSTVSGGSGIEVVRLSTEPVSCDKEATPISLATPTKTADPEEQMRRLRLAEMVEQDEDVVVATKSPSKTRKTRKRKTKKASKHSSAASSKSVSMEQLYEPDELDKGSPSDVVAVTREKVTLPPFTLTEQQEAELSALEQAQQTPPLNVRTPPLDTQTPPLETQTPPLKKKTPPPSIQTPPLKTQTPPLEAHLQEDSVHKEEEAILSGQQGGHEVLEEELSVNVVEAVKEKVTEIDKDMVDGVGEALVEPEEVRPPEEEPATSAVQDVRIEQESGQEVMEEEVGGASDEIIKETPAKDNIDPMSLEPGVEQEVVGGATSSDISRALKSNKKEYKPLFDESSDHEDSLFGGIGGPAHNIGSSAESHEKSPDYSNPLYQDSDEEDEQRLGYRSYHNTGREWMEQAAEFGHARRERLTDRGLKASFMSLQPTAFDPLQSEEFEDLSHGMSSYNATFSPDHTLAHARYSSSPEQPPSRQQPQSLPVSSNLRTVRSPPPQFAKTPTVPPTLSKESAKHHVTRDDRSDGSDSSHESDNEVNMDDSQVVADWYQLCGDLVQDSRKTVQERPHLKPLPPPSPREREESANFEPVPRRRIERAERSFEEEEESSPNADIWVPIPHPSRHNLQSMCLSEKLLWVVDTRWNVYCTTMESRGRDWQNIKRNMNQVSSSQSGKNVWAVYRHNAYVRLGIGMNPEGSQWKNVTKNTHLAHRIKQISVDETAVWAIGTDGKVLYRKDVGEATPEGKVWLEVNRGLSGFSYIACCQGIVWAITTSGKVYCRTGITPSFPSGKKWTEVKSPKFVSISITTAGVVWGVNQDNSIGFKCGVSVNRPGGKGPWWEVGINALNTAHSPLTPLWHVMSPDGNSILTSVSSFVTTNLPSRLPSLPTLPGLPGLPSLHGFGVNKVLSISASAKSGVVVLETGSRLHACWRSTTGFHYSPACKGELFQFMSWSKLAAGGSALWLVRSDDGDLYSLAFGEQLKRIECPAKVDLLAASPHCMWIVSKDSIWSRQALTPEIPEGISFDYIELSTQLHEKKLRDVACGKRSVWAVDMGGTPHFRFGVHAREPGTGMSPAWVPVEDNPQPLLKVTVSPDDWLVWACDVQYNVYVRTGVTVDFPVGRSWELIPGEHVKDLCASNEKVYALSQGGELLCRYGISENNVQGNYWRKMPGKYEKITVGEFGDLWAMDSKGQVWKQEWKVMTVSSQLTQDKDFEAAVEVDPEWEML